jgi:hypothetical protein
MDRSNPKQTPKASDPASDKASAQQTKAEPKSTTGRVKFDDRGNAIWEWSLATGAFSQDVSTQRLQRLENPTLSIADDAPTPFDTVKANPLGTKKGYDPYDSGKLAKAADKPRKKDLRKLSEWVALRNQANAKKDQEED